MWDLPRAGLEPLSPALAGGFSTTVPPGKSPINIINLHVLVEETEAQEVGVTAQDFFEKLIFELRPER